MANIYEAHLSNGKVHQVSTDSHHSSHSEQDFKKMLQRILESGAGGVVSGTVMHFVFKGRK
jgi:hypothetical protein